MRFAAIAVLLLSACGRLGYATALTAGDGGPLLDVAPDVPDSTPPADTGIDAATDAGIAAADATVDTGAADSSLPDAGPCDESPCRLVSPQCGCAAGQACQRPGGDDPLRACVAPGLAGVNEACRGNLDCETAAVCVATGFTEGLCTEYCASGADCATGVCAELVVMTEDIGACVIDCDPVSGVGCGGAAGCGVGLTREVPSRAFAYVPICSDPALPSIGDACPMFLCGPNLVCEGDVCRRVCDRPMGICPTGESCRALSPVLMVRGREVGVCR